MQNIENIKKVSLVFFLLIGLTHILSTLMISSDFSLKFAEISSKILLVPFLATALIYGLSSLRIMLFPSELKHRILDTTFIALGVILIASTIVITAIY
jgi:hypothetical protein